MDRIMYAIKRRPFRLVEALIGVLGAVGVVLLPETEDAVYAVIGALVAAGIIGGEVAQARTTPWEPGTVTVRPSSTDPDDIGDPPEDIGTEEVDG